MESQGKDKALKRILICMDWYEPGFKAGGPIRSVANIVNALKNEFEFYVLTSAFDLGETEPYPDIELDQWFDKDGVMIKYMSRGNMKSAAIKGNILEIDPDILYLNSLFSKLYTLVPMTLVKKIPIIIAPRGMLGAGALEIKKLKKSVFLKFTKLMRFYKSVTWHASTVEEEKEIRAAYGSSTQIVVAQNIPTAQQLLLEDIIEKRKTGVVRFLFISRIAKKKNLHLAVQALREVKSEQPVEFHIYGNIEDESYFKKIEGHIKDYGNVSIAYKGPLNPALVPTTFLYADYFILPTKHENYGHAIVESWANGCPVIVSKNTPWKGLRVRNLGWDVDISEPEALLNAVQEAIDLNADEYLSMVKESYVFFKEKISDKEIIEANRKLFHNAC
ncbi:MAG: glycosyltransferase involved in cell wall biosynthesis [Crocinitomix sp.]|jgi:glycosyltransferase involved in cell wall biosynthesis